MSSDDDLGKCSLKNKTSAGGNIFNIENSYGGIPQVKQAFSPIYHHQQNEFAISLTSGKKSGV